MRYGVTINNKHTERDYNLILTNLVISEPVLKEERIDIFGRNGSIDMSDVFGSVTYDNRTITMQFHSLERVKGWTAQASRLRNDFNGKKVRIVCDDDIQYFWTGRITSIKQTFNGRISDFEIVAVVEPFKRSIKSSSEPWFWDTFNFLTDVINSTGNVEVNGTKNVFLIVSNVPEIPVITSDSEMTYALVNSEGESTSGIIEAGENKLFDSVMTEGLNTFAFNGHGIINIEYRKASL